VARELCPQRDDGPSSSRAQLTDHAATGVRLPVNSPSSKLRTDPLYLDVRLPAGAEFRAPVATGYNAFLYSYEGGAQIGAADAAKPLPHRAAGVLSNGDGIRVQAGAEPVRLLFLAARPLREPVVQYGPFVMNTREEIEQALADYRNRRLAAAA
jgi:quercetin 2,3-dioxygenase